jgi:hypothetical protein
MKTPHQLALEKAEQQIRFRETRSWSWEEIQALADMAGDNITTDFQVGYDMGRSEAQREAS